MARLDQEYASLLSKLKNKDLKKEEITEIERKLQQRKQLLLPIYKQVAVHFADLHDTPGRMKAKDVILEKITWKDSRRFFAHRLRRRIEEQKFVQKIRSADPSISHSKARNIIAQWFIKDNPKNKLNWETNNVVVSQWLQSAEVEIFRKIEEDINKPALIKHLTSLSSTPATVTDTIVTWIKSLPGPQREEIKKILNRPPNNRTKK